MIELYGAVESILDIVLEILQQYLDLDVIVRVVGAGLLKFLS